MSDLLPYCDSFRCAGMKIKGVLKLNVPPKTLNCPDCESALLWKRPNSYLNKKASTSKNKDRLQYDGAIARKEMRKL